MKMVLVWRFAAPSDMLLRFAVFADLQDALYLHNKYRSDHGVSLLTWSADLAKQAQAVADGCGDGGSIDKNAPMSLAWGYQSFASVCRAWYGEVSTCDEPLFVLTSFWLSFDIIAQPFQSKMGRVVLMPKWPRAYCRCALGALGYYLLLAEPLLAVG